MRHQAARNPVIDGFHFAEVEGSLSVVWPIARFGRVQDLLSSDAGELVCVLNGCRDESGRPCLRVGVTGTLQLACQRCLGGLTFPLAIDSTLLLARSEAEIDARPMEPEGPDSIVAGKEMNVLELLEDEILLAIPVAPRHERCSDAGASNEDGTVSPFADLRTLLGRGGRMKN